VFESDGTFNVIDGSLEDVEVLVVAGGGAGGGSRFTVPGGGGGAGGYIHVENFAIELGNYDIAVGEGGLAISGSVGGNGENSAAFGVEAVGGGGGGIYQIGGNDGGSGGGGSRSNLVGGAVSILKMEEIVVFIIW